MQSESIEDLYKHHLEMQEPDHEAKLKEHINILHQVAMNIKVAQNKYKKHMTRNMPRHLIFVLDSLF